MLDSDQLLQLLKCALKMADAVKQFSGNHQDLLGVDGGGRHEGLLSRLSFDRDCSSAPKKCEPVS